jgi:glycosyltransferase involved in cell wall biosynthesis
MGIVEKPIQKENGISVFMRVKNEEDWIKYSILSIRDFADEIIIGDNGSEDNSVEIVEQLIQQGLKIKFYKCPHMKIDELSNFLLKKASYRWIMKWDADFVARTTGKYSILQLRQKLLEMDWKRYYLIMISHICLSGDLHHQDPHELIHTEEYIYTNSDLLTFVHPGTCESLRSPKYYTVSKFNDYYSFHIDVKPADRMLARSYWFDWMELKDYEKYPTLNSYVEHRVTNENIFETVKEAEVHFVIQACKNLVPYDHNRFGDYPAILEQELHNPKYQIVYRDGQIIGRNDIID